MNTCNFFWGSHGCSREPHADTLHECGTPVTDEERALVKAGELHPDAVGMCCQYDEGRPEDERVRHEHGTVDKPQWGDWGPYGDGFWM